MNKIGEKNVMFAFSFIEIKNDFHSLSFVASFNKLTFKKRKRKKFIGCVFHLKKREIFFQVPFLKGNKMKCFVC